MNVNIYHDNLLISLGEHYNKLTLEECLEMIIEQADGKSKHQSTIMKNLKKYRNVEL